MAVTWLSLVISLVVSCFVLSFFPRDVLDEISGTELSQFLRNQVRFGLIPVRSGRFGPNSGSSRFGPVGASHFGPVS